MNEWQFAKVKYTAPHNVPRLIEAADAAIAELEAFSNTSVCIFCGETMEKDLTVMLDHAKGCGERPENRLMARIARLEAITEGQLRTITRMNEACVQAEATIERLKCCGNCVQYGDWGEDTPCGADIGLAIKALPAYRPPLHCEPSAACHFTPSRWAARV